jgi:TATA-box binding protein (TBP) (component of TFIID and TFIIIB)
MYHRVANNTFSYLLTLDEFRKTLPEDICPSWVKITTITMISGFSEEVKIDINKLRSLFDETGYFRFKMEGLDTDKYFEWKLKPSTTFYNQVTLTYKDDYSTKSIKVFPNGSIQVAGCSDLFDCKRIISQLSYLFKEKMGIEQDLPLENFRVVMINSNFSLNYNINLLKIAQHFESYKDIFEVSFEPDRYSAVKIKFKPAEDMKRITTSIFSTGKVIITGAENLKEIAFAYNIINHHINECPGIRVTPTEIRDDFNIFMGYNSEDLIKHLKQAGFSSWTKTTVNNKINF